MNIVTWHIALAIVTYVEYLDIANACDFSWQIR